MSKCASTQGPVSIKEIRPKSIPKLKSREVSFLLSFLRNCRIVLKFCTEHGSITAVLCAKFQNVLTTMTKVMKKRYFTRFEFRNRFRTDFLYWYRAQDVLVLNCLEDGVFSRFWLPMLYGGSGTANSSLDKNHIFHLLNQTYADRMACSDGCDNEALPTKRPTDYEFYLTTLTNFWNWRFAWEAPLISCRSLLPFYAWWFEYLPKYSDSRNVP